MRIAMFTNNYKPFIGGVPISIERLADGLRKLGHETVVFAPDYGTKEHEDHVVRYKTLYQSGDSGLIVGNFLDRNIEKQFTDSPFDLIHVHHPMISGYAGLYLGKKYKIPVVYTYHTRYEEYLHYFKLFSELEQHKFSDSLASRVKEVLVPRYMAAFANSCDLVFAPTEQMRDFLGEYGIRTKTEILPTGLDDSSFFGDSEAAAAIRAQYKGDKAYLFNTVSRLEKEKNLDFLLEGVARLKSIMGVCFRVMVIGDGNERSHLQELAGRLGILDNLAFTGKVPNAQIRNYQFASDLFLFASKSETQGIVLLEAMAAGAPVVAVRASGVVDIVRSGYNGYMTAENPTEWAQAVVSAVGSPDHYRKLRLNSVLTANNYRSLRIASAAAGYYGQAIRQHQADNRFETVKNALQSMDFRSVFKSSR